MRKVVVSIHNGLLSEAIMKMLDDSGEFIPYHAVTTSRKSDAVEHCEMVSADLVIAEVAYSASTSVDSRLREARELRRRVPECKIVFLCDENSTPEITREVTQAKRDGVIDNFFYSSVTTKYLLAALTAV